jgi:hypothetical protein
MAHRKQRHVASARGGGAASRRGIALGAWRIARKTLNAVALAAAATSASISARHHIT